MSVGELKTKLNEAIAEKSHPESAKLCRTLLESCVDFIFEKSTAKKPKNATLLELIDSPVVTSYVDDPEIISSLHYVRILGMHAQHGRKIQKKEAKLAQDNIGCLVEIIVSKENGTQYKKPPYMSEANTRRLYIDLYLKEAGWEVLEIENEALPEKAGIEIKVEGMPNDQGIGFCDYVLYGRDARPLAIVEVKKTSVSPEIGRHQANLYADCMAAVYGYRPVIYYTNGYITKVIDGIYPDRKVMALHSLEELELMIQRRKRGDITDFKINDEITNRPYQKIAVTNICEWLNSKHRSGLLVMATGTGKTRVAISIVDLLTRNNWIKTVLFLADRTALVKQAKRNFTKLIPSMNTCELSGSGEKDFNARLMFCTYQTMINYIDAEDKRFTTGRFDLIIIDEAHRSIFNRYGSIFKYFDSFLIGLTATPKDEVDANTYQIFGCEPGTPNYDYSLDDAIRDGYLVGYKVINRTSEMISKGIDLSKLSVEEIEALDEYFDDDYDDTPLPDDIYIPGSEIFRYVFNKNTCRQVLEDLMNEGYRVDGGETMGKTIIFAYNHKHAQMIVDCFHEMYPEYPANTCQLVDYSVKYGDDLVVKFELDPVFRIAVSVYMLDTGVDIPAVLNLVFFKKVRSKIRFVQMIGRGTRLCENIYGEGKNKDGFLIFDYCGNFEYFHLNPEKSMKTAKLTLSQMLFNLRIDMLHELQKLEHQQNDAMREYYNIIKNELHGIVVTIKSHDSRIQVREKMQYVDKYYNLDTWVALSPVMVKEVKRHITPLIDSGLNGDRFTIAFDLHMYSIENALLKNGTTDQAKAHIKVVRSIAKYLINEMASVPHVRNKGDDLKRLLSEDLWNNPTVDELEKLRKSLRDLMHNLKGCGRNKVDVDFKDVIYDAEYQPEDTTIDIRTYREKVIDYLEENSDNPVIQKIHNLEPINNGDLLELENVLWHELGTQEEYSQTTDQKNLAVFVRSLIGLSQQAVNEKFGEYLNGNTFNSLQQEFIKTIIDYVKMNGDIERTDLANTEPFSNYLLTEVFGVDASKVVYIVDYLHKIVIPQEA